MIMWVYLAIISAFLLGVYDLLKKASLKENAVMPVLLCTTGTSALLFLPVWILSAFGPESFHSSILYIPEITGREHLLIFLKSVIVGLSWVFAYYAVKHLPITIVSPIRSTGPMWTLLGAVIFFAETLNWVQWTGITISIVFFFLFSWAGSREGISFHRNKWIYFIVIGTLISAASGLYDKYLIRNINNMAVQAYFSFYMIPVILPFVYFGWYRRRKFSTPFEFRYTIPLVGIVLSLADFCYFNSLTWHDSLIAIISSLRRSNVLITFIFGAIFFKEKNITRKLLFLSGMLIGVLVIVLGTKPSPFIQQYIDQVYHFITSLF